jgi:hypothetical protein
VPQIARVRDDEGMRIRAYPRAHRLEGAPHGVFESQQGQLVGGIPPRESFRALGPYEQDRAPPSKPMQALFMDESPDHEPTLIERGMGVHLNHPIAAQRGIRNPRPDRWGLWKPHPPSCRGTARARLK